MLFIPYRVDAVYPRRPVVNVLIIFVTTAVFLAAGGFSETEIKPLILSDWNWKGLIGHMFLHADVVHLAGNLFFLWMFGNAICANTGNFLYLLVYLVLGVVAGAIHLIFDGRPAIGASGAVNGIIGLALAMYPTDRVSVWYWVVVATGTFRVPMWLMAGVWFGFDVWGSMRGLEGVAYFAHIGGRIGGLTLGLLALQFGWVKLTEFDSRSLLDVFKGKKRQRRW